MENQESNAVQRNNSMNSYFITNKQMSKIRKKLRKIKGKVIYGKLFVSLDFEKKFSINKNVSIPSTCTAILVVQKTIQPSLKYTTF